MFKLDLTNKNSIERESIKDNKYDVNPFLNNDSFVIEKRGSTSIIGSANKLLVDSETGESEGVALIHKYKEVDKEQFIKVFIREISNLFELSKTGLKVFGFIAQTLKPNSDEVYIYMPDLMSYGSWASTASPYKGLGELIHHKIIAPSKKPNIWFINPSIMFNGDRIVFMREYHLKKRKEAPKQLNAFEETQTPA